MHGAQVVLVSATLPHEVLEMTHKFMSEPLRVLVKRDELTLEARARRLGLQGRCRGRVGVALPCASGRAASAASWRMRPALLAMLQGGPSS